ncbi:MAG: hypothetical protein WA999_10870 [Spirulinaceae cyanobacterium]
MSKSYHDGYADYFRNWSSLPLILAGPILRKTVPEAVTICVVLKEPRQVILKVYATENGQGKKIQELVQRGDRTTIQLGQNLHLVCVTAKPINNSQLQPSYIYSYDLEFAGVQTNLSPPQSLSQALNAPNFDPYISLSYFDHNLPTFTLPPEDLNHLKIVHGSCRKPHGGERDMLPILDKLLEKSAHSPNDRIHQLFLTGDQIYGDDVADPLLWASSYLGDSLLGWEEDLPMKLLPTGDYEFQKPQQIKPGQRTEVARINAGFTGMLHGYAAKAKSHLFSLGEYYGMYLLCWSPVIWPSDFPKGNVVTKDTQQAQTWDSEVKAIQEFARDLWQVRRALANVPTYMIFDDHDVSDDWCLNLEWCNRVLSSPLGRQTVQNAMLSYGLFQGWGNTPEQFELGERGEKFLQAAQKWSASQGKDQEIKQQLAGYLCIPPLDPESGLAEFQRDGDVLILRRKTEGENSVLTWHYTIRSTSHEVIVLDTRTWRGYPLGEQGSLTPPMLLSPTAFTQQLQDPLTHTEQLKAQEECQVKLTFIVAPTNLVSLNVIDQVQEFYLQQERVFDNDVGDSWNFNQVAFSKLLTTLFQNRDRLIVLSGDIHYSCAVRLNYWSRRPFQASLPTTPTPENPGILVQLTSSAFKNAEVATYLIHTKAKSLFPEQSEFWAGWNERPQLVDVVITPEKISMINIINHDRDSPFLRKINSTQGNWQLAWELAVKDPQYLPDWRYEIAWIPRLKAEKVTGIKRWLEKRPLPNPLLNLGNKLLGNLLAVFWRNRWLQEGREVVGRNNFSVVKVQWSEDDDDAKAVMQDTYWHPPWRPSSLVSSRYFVSLKFTKPPNLPKVLKGNRQ